MGRMIRTWERFVAGRHATNPSHINGSGFTVHEDVPPPAGRSTHKRRIAANHKRVRISEEKVFLARAELEAIEKVRKVMVEMGAADIFTSDYPEGEVIVDMGRFKTKNKGKGSGLK